MTATLSRPDEEAAPVLRSPLTGAWLTRRLRGPADQPRWARPAAGALLVATALLYLVDLSASGYANEFYAAAVQAGTKSWKAMFFGSIDSSNFITVDKPPMSLWPAELLGRVFGFNSWTLLVPQALEGVAAVGLLYATVKRWFGPAAGLLAGALLAITPVAVLMFRFDNPDALMTMLLVLAAYGVTRAVDEDRLRWLLVAGAAMGFEFLTKSLQGWTVLPALTLFYLLAARGGLLRRIGRLLAAGAAIVASAGWWVLIVQLWPASGRPYIGGSGDNTVLGLAFGYNGLSRITGGSSGSPGGGGGAGGAFGGSTGIGRMFNSQAGTQISWLIPAALVACVFLLAVARRTRTDRTRNAVVLWGGWLIVTGAIFSYAQGVFHPYYTVQLAPAIAALVAVGAVVAWRERQRTGARVALAAGIAITAWWSFELLGRSAGWLPWLRVAVLVAGVAAAVAVLAPVTRLRPVAAAAAVAALLTVGGGSAAYALDTARTAHTGSTPSAGPAGTSAQAGFGAGTRGQFPGGATPPNGSTGAGTPPFGQGTGRSQLPGGAGAADGGQAASNSALVALLTTSGTRWAAATVGAQSADQLELASGAAVMAIGGFTGSDPAPTLAQFQAYVKAGLIHYFVAGGGMGGGQGGSGTGSAISQWVAAHYTAKTVGGQTVYDLTQAAS